MTKRKLHQIIYTGDINGEHGGTWINTCNWLNYGYADAVRVTSCADAGLADNAWWIERLTLNSPKIHGIKSLINVLKTSGFELDQEGNITTEYPPTTKIPLAKKDSVEYHTIIMECSLDYGCYDIENMVCIQIKDDFNSAMPNAIILRKGSELKNYVNKYYLKELRATGR